MNLEAIKRKQYYPAPRPEVLEKANQIIAIVADYYNVPVWVVKKKGRVGSAPLVRQIASAIISVRCEDMSCRQIAALFGTAYVGKDGKPDHSTIVHNKEKISGYLTVYDPISKHVHALFDMCE
jgi:chromosomal replication initiation ATPase DnaA